MEQEGQVIGSSPGAFGVEHLLDAAAPGGTPVLFTGERGSDAERVARALHARSPRRAGPFVVLERGLLSDAMLESHLFGGAPGAYPGALHDRRGLVDLARGGTLFVAEVADLPLSTQARLLRLLEEGEPGRGEPGRSVRVVSATAHDLPALVRAGRFREDLYYRLHVLVIPLPARRGGAATEPAGGPPPAGEEEPGAWLEMSYADAKEQALRRFEKGYVETLLAACGGNISAASRRAGMDRSNFKRILRKVRGEECPADEEAEEQRA